MSSRVHRHGTKIRGKICKKIDAVKKPILESECVYDRGFMRNFKGLLVWILFLSNMSYAGWHDNYAEAKKEAEKEGKPLLVTFLGPNWCPWSDQLESEILADRSFLSEIEKDFVLLKVDIPQDFAEGSFPGKSLKDRYRVEECPSLVLIESSGEEIAKLAYLPLQQKELCSYIKETLVDYQKMSRITKKQLEEMKIEELKTLHVKAGRLADKSIKKTIYQQGLKKDPGSFFLLEKYGDLLMGTKIGNWKVKSLRKKIAGRDPENEGGTMRKLAVMDFEALASVKKRQKAEIVVEPLLEYLKHFGKRDRESGWQIAMKISQYFFTRNQIQDALRHAQASFEMAPEEHKKEIAQSIEYLQTYVQ